MNTDIARQRKGRGSNEVTSKMGDKMGSEREYTGNRKYGRRG
jgi:hypothetical protein